MGAAKIILALDKAEGRPSDEWIARLANSSEPARTAGAATLVTRE